MPLDATLTGVSSATLADFTRPGLVVAELREHDTAGIISELSHVLQREGCVPDVLPFYHSALNQELLSNSALECGLAFPHARLNGVKHVRFAFGRTRQPVPWGAKGAWPVQCVFLLAVPATDATTYLQLLASLARLGQQNNLLAQLRAAGTAQAILAVLEKVKLRPG